MSEKYRMRKLRPRPQDQIATPEEPPIKLGGHMPPMFNHKSDPNDTGDGNLEQWRQATQAELEHLNALPLSELATEVMTKGFGPDGPGANDDSITLGQANAQAGPTAVDISYRFAPDWDSRSSQLTSDDVLLRGQISKLVAEGLQELEHASLVRCQLHTAMGHFDWAATRRGRAALESDQIQSILEAAPMRP